MFVNGTRTKLTNYQGLFSQKELPTQKKLSSRLNLSKLKLNLEIHKKEKEKTKEKLTGVENQCVYQGIRGAK